MIVIFDFFVGRVGCVGKQRYLILWALRCPSMATSQQHNMMVETTLPFQHATSLHSIQQPRHFVAMVHEAGRDVEKQSPMHDTVWARFEKYVTDQLEISRLRVIQLFGGGRRRCLYMD